MTNYSTENFNFILAGAATGASISSNIGGIGLVGGFGGIGLGLGTFAGAGAVTGAAVYGAYRAINEGDTTAVGAIGLGCIGGASISTAVGGMGLSFGGTAIGIGMGTMAFAGGVVGLGIYGLAKIFSDTETKESIADTFERMETKIVYQEAYIQAMMELNPFLEEIAWKQKFAVLEIEEELQLMRKNCHQEVYNQKTVQPAPILMEITLEPKFKAMEIEAELQAMKKIC